MVTVDLSLDRTKKGLKGGEVLYFLVLYCGHSPLRQSTYSQATQRDRMWAMRRLLGYTPRSRHNTRLVLLYLQSVKFSKNREHWENHLRRKQICQSSFHVLPSSLVLILRCGAWRAVANSYLYNNLNYALTSATKTTNTMSLPIDTWKDLLKILSLARQTSCSRKCF
jgi:hypothetical protein